MGTKATNAGKLIRDELVAGYGAPVWMPDTPAPETVGVRGHGAETDTARAVRVARRAVAEANVEVRGAQSEDDEIRADADVFLATATVKLRQALAALRGVIAQAVAALVTAAALVSADTASIERQAPARDALEATEKKLHGLHHAALLPARNARETLAPAF